MPTNYPNNIDSYAVHSDNVSENIIAATDNSLQDAVKAIETELGTNPKGIKADVKTRVADIETDISNKFNSSTGHKHNGTDSPSISSDSISATADSTQTPVGLVGTITQWFSWITNRIKIITGKTNWYDTPTKSLEQLNNEKVNKAGGDIITPGGLEIDGNMGAWTTSGWAKRLVLAVAGTIMWRKGTGTKAIGIGRNDGEDSLKIISSNWEDASAVVEYPFEFDVVNKKMKVNGNEAWHAGNFIPSNYLMSGFTNLQIKYGSAVATTDGAGFATILFTSPFPTDCVSVVDWNGDGVTTAAVLITSYGAGAYLKNGFTARAFYTVDSTPYSNKSIRVDYMALGY